MVDMFLDECDRTTLKMVTVVAIITGGIAAVWFGMMLY